MDKETLWLVEWTTCTIFIATELERAVEFAIEKGYELSYKGDEVVVMRHKERGWTNMTIRKVQINKEIPL